MGNRKRILFIIPPYFKVEDYLNNSTLLTKPVFTIPYGVLSIDAFIKDNAKIRIETVLLDINVEALKFILGEREYSPSYLTELVKDKVHYFQPDIVGISALFNTSYNYIEPITTAVKEQSESVLTVIGGGVPTNLYRKILEEIPNIDAVCFGEGEIPMADLINATIRKN